MKRTIICIMVLASCCTANKSGEADFYQDASYFKDADFTAIRPPQYEVAVPDTQKNASILAIGFAGSKMILVNEDKRIMVFDTTPGKIPPPVDTVENTYRLISPQAVVVLNDRKFMVYDLTMDKLIVFLKEEKTGKWVSKEEIMLVKDLRGLTSIAMLPDGSFAGTSINNNQGQVLHFALFPAQKIINRIGAIPAERDVNRYATGMKYRSTCTYDADSGTVTVAHYFTDMIDNYALNGKLHFKIQGPDNYKPMLKLITKGNNQAYAVTHNTLKAYRSLTSDKRYLYALYSGNNHSNVIYLFSRGGKPARKIVSDINFYRICFNEAQQKLYCFYVNDTDEKNKLIYYKLSDIEK